MAQKQTQGMHWRIQEGALGPRPPPPPWVKLFFIFMQFLGKFGQNNRLTPPTLLLAPPPLGNPGSVTGMGGY